MKNPLKQGLVSSVMILSLVYLLGCQSTSPRTGNYPAANAKQSDIAACNAHARTVAGEKNEAKQIGTDAVIGGAGGAGVGAAGGAIGGDAGKGAAIGAIVGAAAGTLYGINENRKQDESYQNAYRECMQNRGY